MMRKAIALYVTAGYAGARNMGKNVRGKGLHILFEGF